MDAHILLSPVGQKTETRFNCFLTENRKSTEMVGTPSTVRKLLPPPTGRSPSLKEGGLGAARALSKILIQLRVQGRNPGRFNGGYGVPRGFKGEKSKSPPNPLGLAERVPSSADDDSPVFRNLVRGTNSFHRLRAVPLPRGGRSGGEGKD